MPLFGNSSAPQHLDPSLRPPPTRRISTPASQRLSTITEGPNANGSVPLRSALRNNNLSDSTLRRPGAQREGSGGAASSRSQETTRTGPPAYEWIPEVIDGDEDLRAPVEGEKLAELRRAGGHLSGRRRDRGGWGRLAFIIGVVLLIGAGLGLGLGVGLTRRRDSSSSSGNGNGNGTTASPPPGTTGGNGGLVQQFPLGEYSFITALRTANTNCTSNPVTWLCYPDSVFDPSDGNTNTSSLTTFNWIITNTSTTYATNASSATSEQGEPANLTIRSTDNPFMVSFVNKSLTYTSSSTNATSARFTFNFQMSKPVIPSQPIMSNDAAAECFFNQTTFTGTLYLNAQRTFPGGDLNNATGIGGYTPWPHAVEFTQSQAGGQDVPACYETINGAVGPRILTGLSPEPSSSLCLCDYRNY